MSKNVPNSVQTCYHVIFWSHHALQGQKLEKENKIEVLKFQKCPKTFLKVSKQVLNLFWGNFRRKKMPSAPRNVETWNNFKKLEKLSHFQNAQKRSQKQSDMFWKCFEEIFSVKLLLTAPWRFERRKMENMENFNISKVSETVPNSVQISSELVLRYFFRKEMASTHWRVATWKTSKKNRKEIQIFRNVQKRTQQCSNMLRGDFFWNHHALQGRKMEKNERKIGLLKFEKCPKTFLKVSKLVLNLFWGNFLGKKVPSAPRNVKTWNNFKKLEKLSHFENDQKRSQKQSNMFWTCFEEFFWQNCCSVHPGGSREEKMENMESFNISKMSKTVPNSVQTCSELVLR